MVIGEIAQQGLGAIYLFKQDNAGKLVRKRKRSESDGMPCSLLDGVVKAKGSADDKTWSTADIFG